MRIADIVEVRKGRIVISQAFQRALGLHEGSRLYVGRMREGDDREFIITPIPPECWKSVLTVSIRLEHRAGALNFVADELMRLDGNVINMEGYGRALDKEGWWSALVDFTAALEKGKSLRAIRDGVVARFRELCLERVAGETFPFSSVLHQGALSNLDGTYPTDCVESDGGGGTRLVNYVAVLSQSMLGETETVLVQVSDMRISSLFDRVNWDLSMKDGCPFIVTKCGLGEVSIEAPNGAKNPLKRGFLMSNTEERYLRFVEIESPAEIQLAVKSTGEKEGVVGQGVVKEVTDKLLSVRVTGDNGGQSDAAVNIIYVYNYVISREHKGRATEEQSVMQFFLKAPGEFSNAWSVAAGDWAQMLKSLGDLKRAEVIKENCHLTVWTERGSGFLPWKNRVGHTFKWQGDKVCEEGFWVWLKRYLIFRSFWHRVLGGLGAVAIVLAYLGWESALCYSLGGIMVPVWVAIDVQRRKAKG